MKSVGDGGWHEEGDPRLICTAGTEPFATVT
jgi:hypothetical protein